MNAAFAKERGAIGCCTGGGTPVAAKLSTKSWVGKRRGRRIVSETIQQGAKRAGPFSAYYNRPPAAEPSPLARTGPGTACGEYLRRYWHPIIMISEVSDVPKVIRILGEDLVIFRDKSGDLGLLHKHCIHRGASLEFGIPQQHGIMCCYHGWHFAVDGTVLSAGAEPPTSRIPSNFCQGAYPVRELGGLIFAYMGPPEHIPPFPMYHTFSHPEGNKLYPVKMHMPCNWAQVLDNAIDPIHNSYLHAIVSGQQFSPAFNALPAMDFLETPLGLLSVQTRVVNENVFIRSLDVILPNVAQITSAAQTGTDESFRLSCLLTRWVVPIDDENCFYTCLFHFNDRTQHDPIFKNASWLGVDSMNFIGQTADRPYVERQREPGDYDAIVSQGEVANYKNEHLGVTDRGVVMQRRMIARAIEAVQNGQQPAAPRIYGTGEVPTYNFEFISKRPSRSSLGDTGSLSEFAKRAAQIVIESGGMSPLEREANAGAHLRRLLNEEPVR
jgi:nitrite reductase/ring-hydroxylating ferredoxin subunit